jgi:hypothetical protein
MISAVEDEVIARYNILRILRREMSIVRMVSYRRIEASLVSPQHFTT